jgi:hypothetical protein
MVSKETVLALARRHIEALEKRETSLEGEREILMEEVQRLEGVSVGEAGGLTFCSMTQVFEVARKPHWWVIADSRPM